MNLTIQQVSKITKLSVPTLYAYTSKQRLGKKVGNKKVFTQADVQKLLKGSKPNRKSKPKTPAKRATRKAIKAEPIASSNGKAKPASVMRNPTAEKSQRPSIWTRLFGGQKKPQKVSLMDAKTTK